MPHKILHIENCASLLQIIFLFNIIIGIHRYTTVHRIEAKEEEIKKNNPDESCTYIYASMHISNHQNMVLLIWYLKIK